MQTTGRLAGALLAMLIITSQALAQDRASAIKQAAAAQVRAVTASASKAMPDVTLRNICDPSTMRARSGGNTLSVACVPTRKIRPSRLTAKPDVQASDVTCKYVENDEGGFDAKSCKCSADADSDCTGFITWCAKQGGDVSGNNQSAECG